jgi:hypothetical protein
MGDADARLSPAPPPPAPPKSKAAAPRAAAAPVSARTPAAAPKAAAPRAVAPPPPPPAAPEPGAPRRWLRSQIGAFAILLALVGGEMAARYRPESAIKFQQAVADARDRLPASIPSSLLPALAAGLAIALVGVLVWQAGRARRPLFMPVAVLLCLASAAVGLFRGGHDIDVERNAALLKGRAGSLEGELGKLRKSLDELQKAATKQLADKDQTMAQALEGLEHKLREQTTRAQEAQAERDKMAGSLQSSSIVHQATLKEKDEALSALRKELEELKKKFAEKP